MRIATHWPLPSAPELPACGAPTGRYLLPDGGPRAPRFLEPGSIPPRGYCRECVKALRAHVGLWLALRARHYYVPREVSSKATVRRWDANETVRRWAAKHGETGLLETG